MESVGVIGFGRFGKLLSELLSTKHKVLVFDPAIDTSALPNNAQSVSEAEVLACDTIFYAVPISRFEVVLAGHYETFKKSKKPKLLIDVLSVKNYAREVLERLLPKDFEAILTHPMFGPDSVAATGLPGKVIVVDKFRASDRNYAAWRDFFKGLGLTVLEMSADEHDRLAARSQGVTHFIGRVLDEMGMAETAIDTLGASRLLEIKRQTCNDSWELFTDLQNRNPHTIEMRVELGEAVDRVYSKLLPSRIYKDRLVIGIQGGKGSFNEEAVQYYLKRAGETKCEIQYLYTAKAVMDALHRGKIDRGQVAIHNSTGGVVQESIEAMADHKFRIVEQFSIKIAHAIMIRSDANFSEVDTVMTHPQVLRQCRKTLAEKYERLKLTSGEGELVDHAKVAELLGKKELPKNIGTMGSKMLADIYGLKLIEDNLQDLSENYTSFMWVERL